MINMSENYVWYACYGSNMLKERFMYYIKGGVCRFNGAFYRGGKDKSDPVDERLFTIPHQLYFGMEAPKWKDGGVAFLNPEKDESFVTLGRLYKITSEQFNDVQGQEGGWYSEVLELGELDEIPVKTFTHSTIVEKNRPCDTYIDVIRLGLKETYPDLSDAEIEGYLENSLIRNEECNKGDCLGNK